MTHFAKRLGCLALTFWLCACSVINVSTEKATLSRNMRWALLPVLNHTETPQAGLRAETILLPLLHQQKLDQLTLYPASLSRDSLLSGSEQASLENAKRWAREQGIRYAISGSVDEWRYKVGVDGEPAVGINLIIWDLTTDRIVWSAVGGKAGYSREAISVVAQKLMQQMINRLPLIDGASEAAQ